MKIATSFSPVPVVMSDKVVEICKICGNEWNVYKPSEKAYVCPKCTRDYVGRPRRRYH